MWRFFGLAVGCGAGVLVWGVVHLTDQGLPVAAQSLLLWPTVGLAVLVAFLAGASIVRRAQEAYGQVGLFSTVAGAVAGGIIGLVTVAGITASYLAQYASWPGPLLEQVLLVLAPLAFGLVGGFAGMFAGSICGATAGAMLRLVNRA